MGTALKTAIPYLTTGPEGWFNDMATFATSDPTNVAYYAS